MYQTLLFLHNLTRWLVLLGLFYALFRAYKGYVSNAVFSKTDNAVRHWTATIAHTQLLIGMILYFHSPVVKYFMKNSKEAIHDVDVGFFGWIHGLLMLTAIVLLTIGSAKAKRQPVDREKYKTMLTWFSIALILIIIAIPWPFSPLACRPYFR